MNQPDGAGTVSRRDLLAAGMSASALAAVVPNARANASAPDTLTPPARSERVGDLERQAVVPLTDAQILDRIRIEDVMLRERAARDGGRFDEMAACYHPHSWVEVSWYQGPGAGFVEGTRKMARGPLQTFHVIGQSVVTLRGERALMDTECTVHGILELHGAEMDIVNHCRLLWRIQKHEGQWLIAGMRSIYVRDMLLPINPNRIAQLDQAYLETLRPAYRFIAYAMGKGGHPVPANLPGTDRPDLEAGTRQGEQNWLVEN